MSFFCMTEVVQKPVGMRHEPQQVEVDKLVGLIKNHSRLRTTGIFFYFAWE